MLNQVQHDSGGFRCYQRHSELDSESPYHFTVIPDLIRDLRLLGKDSIQVVIQNAVKSVSDERSEGSLFLLGKASPDTFFREKVSKTRRAGDFFRRALRSVLRCKNNGPPRYVFVIIGFGR